MLLALDVGNTTTHLGAFRGPEMVAHGEISTSRDRTADELGVLLAQILGRHGLGSQALRGAAVASVVPAVTGTVVAAVADTFGVEPYVLRAGDDLGVAVRYDDPRELGADRIANAVGGFARYGGPLIVADFGTATTFDAIAADGAYLGGAIAPGLGIAVEALTLRAARLPQVELARPARAIGTSTAAGMQAGLLLGYGGLVAALLEHIAREMGGAPRVIATGGLAALVVRETGTAALVDRHLTLEGLRVIWGRRVAAR